MSCAALVIFFQYALKTIQTTRGHTHHNPAILPGDECT